MALTTADILPAGLREKLPPQNIEAEQSLIGAVSSRASHRFYQT